MKNQTASPAPRARYAEGRRSAWLAVAALAILSAVAYHNSFSVPFLLDDQVTIQANPSIRHLWPPSAVLCPPREALSAGRPFLNLTFALNYALAGLSVRNYHAFNLLIHGLAGIILFGIVRVTLSLPRLKERYGGVATLLALAVAVVWTVHPVQTESVTYISQRAESLMGLFYLLTLYFFIRSALSSASALWAALSVLACVLGMMTKEVMVSAPLIVFLYDRTFLAGSFREAWRQRWRTYLGLAATWLVLAGLMASGSLQQRGVGYGADFAGWTYALTESRVVLGYLKLAVWPHPLVFDYGPDLRVNNLAEAAPFLILLALLLALTLFALRRWPSLGFLGAWFFLILAPTSSIVPVVGQPMAENRLYLALAAVVSLGVFGFYSCAGRKYFLIGFPVLAIALGSLTVRRNSDYRDEVSIWSDTVLKRPGNSRAHNNLGSVLTDMPDRLPEAISHYEAAVRLNPSYAKAQLNLGVALAKIPDRLPEAMAHYEAALKIKPDFAEAHNNLGSALMDLPGRLPEAISHFETALKIKPDFAEAHNNLGNALANTPGRMPEAIGHFEAALKINPDFAEAHNNLGIALASVPGRLAGSIAHFEAAIKLKPDYAEAHFNLGHALLDAEGRSQDAQAQFEAALRLRPDWEPLVARLRSAQP